MIIFVGGWGVQGGLAKPCGGSLENIKEHKNTDTLLYSCQQRIINSVWVCPLYHTLWLGIESDCEKVRIPKV